MSLLHNSYTAIGFPTPVHFRAGISVYGTTMHIIPARK